MHFWPDVLPGLLLRFCKQGLLNPFKGQPFTVKGFSFFGQFETDCCFALRLKCQNPNVPKEYALFFLREEAIVAYAIFKPGQMKDLESYYSRKHRKEEAQSESKRNA